jgi:hypothetical protein
VFTIIGIFLGEQSQGKTLSMVSRLHEAFLNGYTIYSNFNLNFKHKKINRKLIEEWTNSRKQFNKTIIAIDEIYLMLDSRGSGSSKFNKIFSYFLLQTSKADVHLFGTAQYINTVDRRLRDNVKFKCMCTLLMQNPKTKELNYFESLDRKPDKKLLPFLYVKNGYYTKRIDRKTSLPFYDYTETYIKIINIIDLYDTKEMISIND